MASMDYCLFENTHGDLQSCYDKLDRLKTEGVSAALSQCGQEEREALVKLVQLCGEIYDDFNDYASDVENEDG